MLMITMLLTNAENQRVQQAAQQLWPQERLSRAEICRRFALSGVQALTKASSRDVEAATNKLQMTMAAPDEKLKH